MPWQNWWSILRFLPVHCSKNGGQSSLARDLISVHSFCHDFSWKRRSLCQWRLTSDPWGVPSKETWKRRLEKFIFVFLQAQWNPIEMPVFLGKSCKSAAVRHQHGVDTATDRNNLSQRSSPTRSRILFHHLNIKKSFHCEWRFDTVSRIRHRHPTGQTTGVFSQLDHSHVPYYVNNHHCVKSC